MAPTKTVGAIFKDTLINFQFPKYQNTDYQNLRLKYVIRLF